MREPVTRTTKEFEVLHVVVLKSVKIGRDDVAERSTRRQRKIRRCIRRKQVT
jgi:hypothetical protein